MVGEAFGEAFRALLANIEDTKPIDVLAARVWSGTHYHYPHIETMTAELTRLRTALAESEAMRGRQMKTIDEMRGTIRVLGKECRATRLERERFFDKSSHAEWAESVRLAGEAIMSTNADPAARAAVEGA